MMPLVQAPGCPYATGAMARGVQAALPISSFALMQGFCIPPHHHREETSGLFKLHQEGFRACFSPDVIYPKTLISSSSE